MSHFPVETGREAYPAGVVRTEGIVPYALGAVGHPDGGDAEARDGRGVESVVLAGDEGDFFVQGHLADEVGRTVLVTLGDDVGLR